MTEPYANDTVPDEFKNDPTFKRVLEMTPEERISQLNTVMEKCAPDYEGEPASAEEIELALACNFIISGARITQTGKRKEKAKPKEAVQPLEDLLGDL